MVPQDSGDLGDGQSERGRLEVRGAPIAGAVTDRAALGLEHLLAARGVWKRQQLHTLLPWPVSTLADVRLDMGHLVAGELGDRCPGGDLGLPHRRALVPHRLGQRNRGRVRRVPVQRLADRAALAAQRVAGAATVSLVHRGSAGGVPGIVEQPKVIEIAEDVRHLVPVDVRPVVSLPDDLVDHARRVVPELAAELRQRLARDDARDAGSERAAVPPQGMALHA